MLPPGCSFRDARQQDRWVLQKLVLMLVCTEALGFDLRITAYRLVNILALIVLGNGLWQFANHTTSAALQSLWLMLLVVAGLVAIAQFGLLLLYLLLILTEPLFNWSKYWVMEWNQRPIACAALVCFGEFCVLYHLVVDPQWRRHAIASHLVTQLTQQTNQPIYLACKPNLVSFYQRLGFYPVQWKNLSPSLKAHFKDFHRDRKLSGMAWEIMRSSQNRSVSPHTTVK